MRSARVLLLSVLVMLATSLPARAQSSQFTDDDIEIMYRNSRRDELVDWHRQLVDRYNALLNRIAFARRVDTKVRRKVSIPSIAAKNLHRAYKVLSRSELIGSVQNRTMSKAARAKLVEDLDSVQSMLEKAEAAWRESGADLNQEIAQLSECSRSALDAAPIDPQLVAANFNPIEECLRAQKIAVNGSILTYHGGVELEKMPKPVKIFSSRPEATPPTPEARPDTAATQNTVAEAKPDVKSSAGAKQPAASTSKLKTKVSPEDVQAAADYVQAAADKKTRPDFDWLDFVLKSDLADQRGVTKKVHAKALANLNEFEETSLADLNDLPGASNETIYAVRNAAVARFLGDYRSGQESLTQALLGKGANCVAQTNLLWGLLKRNKITPDAGQVLGVNVFSGPPGQRGHVQLIVYDPKTKLAWNPLVPEVKTPLRGDLYDPAILADAWLMNVGAKGVDPQKLWIASGPLESAEPPVVRNQAQSVKKAKLNTQFPMPMGSGTIYSYSPNPAKAKIAVRPFPSDIQLSSSFDGDFFKDLAEGDGGEGWNNRGATKSVTLTAAQKTRRNAAIRFIREHAPELKDLPGPAYVAPMTKKEIEKLSDIVLSAEERARYGTADERQSALFSTYGLYVTEVASHDDAKIAVKSTIYRQQNGLDDPNAFSDDLNIIEKYNSVKSWDAIRELLNKGEDLKLTDDIKSEREKLSDFLTENARHVSNLLAEHTVTPKYVPDADYDLAKASNRKRLAQKLAGLQAILSPEYAKIQREALEAHNRLSKDPKKLADKISQMDYADALKTMDAIDLIDSLAIVKLSLGDQPMGLMSQIASKWDKSVFAETDRNRGRGERGIDYRTAIAGRLLADKSDLRRSRFESMGLPKAKAPTFSLDQEIEKLPLGDVAAYLTPYIADGRAYGAQMVVRAKIEDGKAIMNYQVEIGHITDWSARGTAEMNDALPPKLRVGLLMAFEAKYQFKERPMTASDRMDDNIRSFFEGLPDRYYSFDAFKGYSLYRPTYGEYLEYLQWKQKGASAPAPAWFLREQAEFERRAKILLGTEP